MKSKSSTKNTTRKLCALGVLLISACAYVERQIDTPGVTIERIPTDSGTIRSAFFVEYKHDVYLAGHVCAKLSSKLKLFGHVHVGVRGPNGEDVLCAVAPHRNPWQQFRKPYRVKLERAPRKGSVVHVRHHKDTTHQDCHTS